MVRIEEGKTNIVHWFGRSDGGAAYNAVISRPEFTDLPGGGAGPGGSSSIIRFIVGETDAPADGSNTYSDTGLDGLTTDQFVIFRNGLPMWPVRDYTFSGNTITINDTWSTGEEVVITGGVTSSSGSEPVTVQEAKDWAKIEESYEDSLVAILISAARIMCEKYSNLSFTKRIVTVKVNNGLGIFTLPYGPVTGDVKEDSEIVDPNEPFGIKTVTYTGGYDVLPENLRIALLNQFAFLYQHRGDEELPTSLTMPTKLILKQVRILV